uniref:Peptidase_M1 domain-containing protein n=1 Tax=Angiostrongylus cantonensis TaxID=6313 RepID=A0A0K0D444_ANGCA
MPFAFFVRARPAGQLRYATITIEACWFQLEYERRARCLTGQQAIQLIKRIQEKKKLKKLISESALLYDENLYDPLNKERVAVVIAHELAHQWFGNLVTMQWWDDLWLNEGFATMVEYSGADEISNGQMRMKDYFLLDGFTNGLAADSVASSHPLSFKIDRATEVLEAFDQISYGKGGSLLVMLSALIGEEIFKKSVTVSQKKSKRKHG